MRITKPAPLSALRGRRVLSSPSPLHLLSLSSPTYSLLAGLLQMGSLKVRAPRCRSSCRVFKITRILPHEPHFQRRDSWGIIFLSLHLVPNCPLTSIAEDEDHRVYKIFTWGVPPLRRMGGALGGITACINWAKRTRLSEKDSVLGTQRGVHTGSVQGAACCLASPPGKHGSVPAPQPTCQAPCHKARGG